MEREQRTSNSHLAAVALGANVTSPVGGPRETIAAAVEQVRLLGEVIAVSTLRETMPVGPVPDQPRFLNGVLLLETSLAAETLMRSLLAVERQLGRDRTRAVAKGPRTIDLDLLFYDDLVMSTAALTLPHPAMGEREFVLQPLAEIAPAWRHPVLGNTAVELLETLRRQDPGHQTERH